VDGDPITRNDLEYALEVAHRREDLSTAGTLNIDGYMNKLVDERLIVHEARRMGIADHQEVRDKVDAFILRESVMRLYNDEILSKVSLSEDEVLDYYRDNYKRYLIDIVESGSEEKASEIAAALRAGAGMEELSAGYPESVFHKGDPDAMLTRSTIPGALVPFVEELEPGMTSGVIAVQEQFYVIRLVKREDAPEDQYSRVKGSIKSMLSKAKVDDRSDAYLSLLHGETSVHIDRDILSSIDYVSENRDRNSWLQDSRTVVTVEGEVLTAGQLAALLPVADEATKDRVVRRWLDRKLVDLEALGRKYHEQPPLMDRVRSYRNRLINNVFTRETIVPGITISDDEVNDYYERNRHRFMKPVKYRVQQITLRTREDAESVRENLQGGASFSWLAKNRSVDSYASSGGIVGWKVKDTLREPVKKIIEDLQPGDISPVLKIDSNYVVIRLMERSEERVEELDRVRKLVTQGVYREKYVDQYTGFVGTLRQKADIEIMDETVQSFKERFK
jgi:parvulin-like peptidyl-prolyl isomerase